MENPLNFLKRKYSDLEHSHPVNRAARPESIPLNDKLSRIHSYLERLERITNTDRGRQLLTHMITKDFIINEDEETLKKLARALNNSEKQALIDKGYTNQIQQLEISDEELINKYKNAILEKRSIQKKTLDSWLSYLGTTNDYPMWFKYYTVRSLQNMGQFHRYDHEVEYQDKDGSYQEKTITGPSYSNRTDDTIAPFPEPNSEALGFVRKSLETQMEIEGYKIPADIEQSIINTTVLDNETIQKILIKAKPQYINDATAGALKNLRNQKRKEYIESHKTETIQQFADQYPLDENRKENLLSELTNRIHTADFAKLYSFGMVECAGNLDRSSLIGNWIKYDKGSDYTILENSLKGKGTGWCTAEGSAQGQIKQGDFYVYYTNNKDGNATEPRIAIRMGSDGTIGEIRGVNPRQEMEPELVDTAKEFYQDLPGSEKYEKADADMKYLTSIYNRIVKTNKETNEKTYLNIPLSREELRFLYELDSPIQGFGYDKDPRVDEIRSHRDVRNDLSIIYNTPPETIAMNESEITPETKICIKELNPYNTTLNDLQNLTDNIICLQPGTYTHQFSFLNPADIDWKEQIQISRNRKASKNSFTINLETQNLNYETLGEPTILFKPEWVGKPHGDVFAEIIAEYGHDYYIPGFEYQTYLAENPAKIPQQLKGGNWYFTPGSLRGDSGVGVNVPVGNWNGSVWNRDEGYVEGTWGSAYRVVLFRKSL